MARPDLAVVFLVFTSGSAASQDLSDLAIEVGRAVELPAHQSLMKMVGEEKSALAEFTTDGCSGGVSVVWTFIAKNFPAFAEVHRNAPPWHYYYLYGLERVGALLGIKHIGGDDFADNTEFACRGGVDLVARPDQIADCLARHTVAERCHD